MPAMDRVGYMILFVADLDRSVAFYRDVLGVPFKLQGDGYVEFATQGRSSACTTGTGSPS